MIKHEIAITPYASGKRKWDAFAMNRDGVMYKTKLFKLRAGAVRPFGKKKKTLDRFELLRVRCAGRKRKN
ncbi:MAG: hypothetical protein AAF518_29030, partial [Spirochaetota bacterium]